MDFYQSIAEYYYHIFPLNNAHTNFRFYGNFKREELTSESIPLIIEVGG